MTVRLFRVSIASVSALFCAVPATQAENLTDALALAYATNPTIRAERARLDATEEARAQAWAGALPQITAGANITKNDNSQTASFGGAPQDISSDFETRAASVTGETAVFTGFRNFNAIKQAGARIRAGGAQLAATEQQVLREVADAYFNVQRTMAVFSLNQKNVEVLARQKELADVRFEVGQITRTDVAQSQARLANAQANFSAAQSDLAIARAEYARLVGQAPADLDPVEELPELPENRESALALADRFAPALIAAREQSEVARRQVSIARGEFSPTISITAGYEYAETPSAFVDNSENFSYGARASMPIFLGGLNFSRVREAKAQHRAAEIEIAESARLVEANVTAAWERMIAARSVIRSAAASVEANELALEGVKRESDVGSRTTLDVLDAEQELLNAQVTLVSAEADSRSAAFALLAATGLLTPEAVGVDVDEKHGFIEY
ncbi:MAG: TolC family outer membrane protein [Pseudomonadota bacterium]